MKTLKETEDTAKDVEKKGQITWCFISKGRANRKRPILRIYVQLTGTHPPRDTVFV